MTICPPCILAKRFTIASPNYIWARLEGYAADFSWIKLGQHAELLTYAYPGETFAGNVTYLDPEFDPDSRTFSVGILFRDPQKKLRPNMLVRCVIHSRMTAKGVALPYTILNPERRITHAAITENKRLSAVLEYIKAEQDKAPPKIKVKPESARNGYKKTGKRPPGRPSKMEGHYARKRAEREARAASLGSDI